MLPNQVFFSILLLFYIRDDVIFRHIQLNKHHVTVDPECTVYRFAIVFESGAISFVLLQCAVYFSRQCDLAFLLKLLLYVFAEQCIGSRNCAVCSF